ALDEPKSGHVIAEWNKAILNHGDPIQVAKPAKMIGDRVLVEIRASTHPINAAAKLTYTWRGLELVDPANLNKLVGALR
ncbi:MAG TPA: hypothetical protein VN253_16975, partial [Kofleriaceae bacterium]|nr:hypothetical protein [Kofleriaceae bacterium]